MKTKRTNKLILVNGIKNMGFSLLFMFLGPTVIYIAFSNQEKPLYIPLLILGITLCFFGVFFIFKGLKLILDSMFKK